MSAQNKKINSKFDEQSVILNSLALETCRYGLEYVIDEIFKESSNTVDKKSQADWFGLSDLTLD